MPVFGKSHSQVSTSQFNFFVFLRRDVLKNKLVHHDYWKAIEKIKNISNISRLQGLVHLKIRTAGLFWKVWEFGEFFSRYKPFLLNQM